MNRMINMILRVVVLELVRRGTNVAIDRFANRRARYDEPSEGKNLQNQSTSSEQGLIDKRETRRRMRLIRGRF